MINLFFAVVVTIACCLGCSGLVVHQSPILQLPPDPAAYLSDIWAKSMAVSDVSGFAKLCIASNNQTTTSRNVFFVKRSGRIRIETLGFLSRPVFFFTADKYSMQLYAVEDNALFTGETSARNFFRIIGMPLDLMKIVRIFFGQPPLLKCSGSSLRGAVENGQYVFSSDCGDFSERVYVDPKAKRISRSALFKNGLPVYDYKFTKFEKIDDIFFPLKIEFYNYTYNTAATLDLDSLSFAIIPDERFMLTHPDNVRQHALEELGSPG